MAQLLRKLFKAFPLISVGVIYRSVSQKPRQTPMQALHTVCERDEKLLQSPLVGITVMHILLFRATWFLP